MNTWSPALMLRLIDMFIQRLMKVVGIGIVTPRLRTARCMKRKSSRQSFGVIVDFTVLKNSFDCLKGLSAKLQRRDIDVFDAYTMIDNIKSEFRCLV